MGRSLWETATDLAHKTAQGAGTRERSDAVRVAHVNVTTSVFTAALALGLLSLMPTAGAHPMKECSARHHAAAKAGARTQCRAAAPNVFSRRPSRISLGIGDVVSITIFEAEVGGLFVPGDAGARPGNFVTLPNQIVDSNGNITVPYAGTIRAAGRTPSEVLASDH